MCNHIKSICTLCRSLLAIDRHPCSNASHNPTLYIHEIPHTLCIHPSCPYSPLRPDLSQSDAQSWFLHGRGLPRFTSLLARFLHKAMRVLNAPSSGSDAGSVQVADCRDVHHASHSHFIAEEFVACAVETGRADRTRFPRAVIACLQHGRYPDRTVMRALAASFGAVFFRMRYQACFARNEKDAWRMAVERRWENADWLVRHGEFERDEMERGEMEEWIRGAWERGREGEDRLVWEWVGALGSRGRETGLEGWDVFPRFVETSVVVREEEEGQEEEGQEEVSEGQEITG